MGFPTWFSSAWTQLVLLSMVMFSCSGMWNALNSMGAGGGSHYWGSVFNATFNVFYIVMSFFGSIFVNVIGPKWSLFAAAAMYPFAAIVLNPEFEHGASIIVVAIFFGCAAGILYVAQGQLMMSYPKDETESGKYIATFWAIFNAGTVIGVAVVFGINFHNDGAGADAQASLVSTAGYWSFFALMCCGMLYSLCILPIHRVTHGGVPIGKRQLAEGEEAEPELRGAALVQREFMRVGKTFGYSSMLFLIPLFFYSNFFYAYHFSIPAALFNGRTAALANITYWSGQIGGCWVLQFFLDRPGVCLRKRMYWSFVGIYLYIAVVWSIGAWTQFSYPISYDEDKFQKLDFKNQAGHKSPNLALVNYALYGVCDALIQVWSYWMMRNISDDPETLARFAGFYKFWQNIGALLSWIFDITIKDGEFDYIFNIVLLVACAWPTFIAIRKVDEAHLKKLAAAQESPALEEEVAEKSQSAQLSSFADL